MGKELLCEGNFKAGDVKERFWIPEVVDNIQKILPACRERVVSLLICPREELQSSCFQKWGEKMSEMVLIEKKKKKRQQKLKTYCVCVEPLSRAATEMPAWNRGFGML